jgi:transcriptional regulator with XRE-family HTH domain
MLEPTVSGQLRRAISESGMDHRELAHRTGLSPKAMAEFLAGRAALDSAAIDKLAALLKQQLAPIG